MTVFTTTTRWSAGQVVHHVPGLIFVEYRDDGTIIDAEESVILSDLSLGLAQRLPTDGSSR